MSKIPDEDYRERMVQQLSEHFGPWSTSHDREKSKQMGRIIFNSIMYKYFPEEVAEHCKENGIVFIETKARVEQ